MSQGRTEEGLLAFSQGVPLMIESLVLSELAQRVGPASPGGTVLRAHAQQASRRSDEFEAWRGLSGPDYVEETVRTEYGHVLQDFLAAFPESDADLAAKAVPLPIARGPFAEPEWVPTGPSESWILRAIHSPDVVKPIVDAVLDVWPKEELAAGKGGLAAAAVTKATRAAVPDTDRIREAVSENVKGHALSAVADRAMSLRWNQEIELSQERDDQLRTFIISGVEVRNVQDNSRALLKGWLSDLASGAAQGIPAAAAAAAATKNGPDVALRQAALLGLPTNAHVPNVAAVSADTARPQTPLNRAAAVDRRTDPGVTRAVFPTKF